MKRVKYLIVLMFALTLGLTSCTKDEAKIASKTWKVVSMKMNETEMIQECDKDDVFTFTDDGKYTANPGTNKCDTDDVTKTGSWSLSDDGKSLVLDGVTCSVVELTKKSFIFSMTVGSDVIQWGFAK